MTPMAAAEMARPRSVVDLFPMSLEILRAGEGAVVVHDGIGVFFENPRSAWVLAAALVHPLLNVVPAGNC
jgi:hypothetical protein